MSGKALETFGGFGHGKHKIIPNFLRKEIMKNFGNFRR
jgi:hypothetical protein